MEMVVDGGGDAGVPEYSRLAADLELQELEISEKSLPKRKKASLDNCGAKGQAPNGLASPQVYGQLLAIYLLQNDLPNAKFLWKRIPQEIKQSNSELGNIWKVGQGLWYKDFPAIYTGLNQDWPDYVKPAMKELGERTRRRALALVAKAYSSISLDDTASFLGVPRPEVADVVRPLGWVVDVENGIVSPKHKDTTNKEVAPSDEQLAKLTDFVAFLEN